jgi:hypothetical protein
MRSVDKIAQRRDQKHVRFMHRDLRKEASLRILLTCVSLACAATILMISHAERQQEAALDGLASYKPAPQPLLSDDPDFKHVTARSLYKRDER